MAIFNASNAAGMGFNMSSTSSSGWAFIGSSPWITVELAYEGDSYAEYELYGSSQVDYFTVSYWTSGYGIVIDDLHYYNGGELVLSIKDLGLYTSEEALDGNSWYVRINSGHDAFYGNDYEDVIRAGIGNDVVYSYAADDIVFGDSGHDSIFGGADDDDLYGGSGRDTLNGGTGSDYLNGGSDSDLMTGGAGKDYFTFDARPSRAFADRIVDFRPLDDTIMLDNAAFTRVGRDGWLSASAFTTGTGAKDSSDRIIYNKRTGDLLYDADGIGGTSAVKFAQLGAGLSLSKSDFFIL